LLIGIGNKLPILFKLLESMKRITALVGSLCLVALFSCKKEDSVTPITDFSKTRNLSVTTVNGKQVNSDTIPPTNAVNVKTYGAAGNGSTDDTKALQNAINGANVLVLNGGTYIINQTLNMRAGVQIFGINGATIKPGTGMSGNLLNNGRYFMINGVKGCKLINLIFKPSSEAFNYSVWANSVIYITNSTFSTIMYNQFNFNQPYSSTGVEGVWVDGAQSAYTLIYKNICNTVGIEYAEAGASYTTAQLNVINNAHANGMSGQGNSTTYCTHNIVSYNTINNAGWNGIVDWSNIDGTQITYNTINGSGKWASPNSDGEGIQAQGVNTIVSHNTIKDAQAEYIEVGSTDKTIDSNILIDTKFLAEGITVNTQPPPYPNARQTVTILNHNTITGCHDGIEIYGANSPSVNIINNTINNPYSTSIEVISKAPVYKEVNINGNTFNFTTPNLVSRTAILTYPGTLTSTQQVSIVNNVVTYTTGANGGAGQETGFSPHSNNVTLSGNKLVGNNIKSSTGHEVYSMNSNGSTFTGFTFLNNNFTGALISITGFSILSKIGNNF
jgi:hypothetical protein